MHHLWSKDAAGDLPVFQCENGAQDLIEDAVLTRVDEILATVDGAAELEIIRYAA